ncbi:MAG: aspartyl protease family protein [Planctomycetota bacterium]|nr:aspartyl protease family protein [Planctomycetota bacterium]
MGEIRVQVKLTNVVDDALARRGQLAADQVRSIVTDAMIDTGAVRSVIPASLLDQLGIRTRGQRMAEFADGRTENVDITEPLLFELLDRDTPDEAFVLGNEVLIGQTVLEKLDLLADCTRQRLVPAHPEGPISKVK